MRTQVLELWHRFKHAVPLTKQQYHLWKWGFLPIHPSYWRPGPLLGPLCFEGPLTHREKFLRSHWAASREGMEKTEGGPICCSYKGLSCPKAPGLCCQTLCFELSPSGAGFSTVDHRLSCSGLFFARWSYSRFTQKKGHLYNKISPAAGINVITCHILVRVRLYGLDLL